MLSRIQRGRWVAAGAPELAGTELAVAARAWLERAHDCRARGSRMRCATASWVLLELVYELGRGVR